MFSAVPGRIDRIDDRVGGIVRKNDQSVRHVVLSSIAAAAQAALAAWTESVWYWMRWSSAKTPPQAIRSRSRLPPRRRRPEHDDLVGVDQRAEAMRDHDDRAAFHQPPQRLDDEVFRFGSSAAVGSSSTRIGLLRMTARAMAMRWRWPPESVSPRSPDQGVVAERHSADELIGIGDSRRGNDFFVGRAGPAIGDVFADRAAETAPCPATQSRSGPAAPRACSRRHRRRRSGHAPSVGS